MHCKIIFLYICFYIIFESDARNLSVDEKLVKRDVHVSSTRKDLHRRVLKYLSGRYKSLPVAELVEDTPDTTTEGSTTMEPLIKVTTTIPPDQININIFGGYFDSILGKSLANHFNVTSKIHSSPPYAMVHYYFRGDFTPPQGAFIGDASLTDCGDVKNFCPEKSSQICLTNGTVYCVVPMRSTVRHFVDGYRVNSLETNVKVQCRKNGLKSCEKSVPLHIPCYAEVTMVEGDECARKKIYKAKYCVIIIAYPMPKYSNGEFIDYLRNTEEGQRILSYQFGNLADVILQQLF